MEDQKMEVYSEELRVPYQVQWSTTPVEFEKCVPYKSYSELFSAESHIFGNEIIYNSSSNRRLLSTESIEIELQLKGRDSEPF